MEILFDKINIILIITVFLNLILGLLIYSRGRDRKINIVYSLNVVTIIVWILAMIFYRSANAENNLFWCIILYISPTFIASSFLYFTYIFPFQINKTLFFKKWLIFLGNIIIVVLIGGCATIQQPIVKKLPSESPDVSKTIEMYEGLI